MSTWGAELDALREVDGGNKTPEPERSLDIAFIGVFHGEGPERLATLLGSMVPWFEALFVDLQGPTEDEIEVCQDLGVRYSTGPKMGFCEATYQDAMDAAREAGFDWVFNLDGDELADATLLASLPYAIREPRIYAAKAARVPRRNTFELPDGRVLPGFNESNARLHRSDLVRPRVVHSDLMGTPTKPEPWHDYGAIRQHRTVNEYVRDQLRFRELAADKSFASGLLAQLEAHLSYFLAEDEVDDLMGEEAMFYVDLHRHPERSWADD